MANQYYSQLAVNYCIKLDIQDDFLQETFISIVFYYIFLAGDIKLAIECSMGNVLRRGIRVQKPVDQNMSVRVVDWPAHFNYSSPDKCATIDLASDRRLTYAELHERVGRLAGHLKSLGIKRGDRVAFLALNSTDILDIILASWRIGAVVLALNYRLTAAELEFIVSDAGATVLFYDHELDTVVTDLCALVSIEHTIGLDGMGGPSTFETAVAGGKMIESMIAQGNDDQCMLMYSSGTTGRPKGVIITHGMIFYAAVNGVPQSMTTSQSVWLSVMPLFHIGGLNVSSLPALWIGATNVVMRNFDPELMLDVISDAELGITHTICVPAMYIAMRQHPKAETSDFSRMVAALAGGASVPKELVEWWFSRGFTIRDGYGMTESAASNCISAWDDVPHNLGTSGKALMYTQMRIVGPNGEDVPQGQTGEIWMRGPTITPGYWNNDAANQKAFEDGWFKSGDIARRDSSGNFIIEDRADDMYISGGENVYPAEIEGVLYELAAIAEVAVIGVCDDKWGETGCAVVVFKQGAELSLADMQAHCSNKLAKFKHPSHMVFLPALPRNATGKVKKFELRKSIPPLIFKE